MSNRGGGRKTCVEWNEVLKIDNDTKVLCKYCKEMISRKIERIKSHLQKCKARIRIQHCEDDPDPSLSIDVDADESASATSSDFSFSTSVEQDNASYQNPKRHRVQASMSNFIVKTTKEEQYSLDRKIAIFFYSANIPFSVIETPQFIDMISSLRPGYVPPNRKSLSGPLLNGAWQDIEEKMKAELDEDQDATKTLLQDGWSSIRNDAIIGTSLHTGKGGGYLLKMLDAGSNKKTAEYCTEQALAAIEDCENKFGKDVFAICTDNEAKMKKMKELVKQHYPNLLTFGCSAHFLNLVAKDISPTQLLSQIIKVQKYFRNTHQPHGWLKENEGKMPIIPNDTRWNSHEQCVSSFLENFHKYVLIASHHGNEFDSSISRILDNVGIYKEAVNLQKQISIISDSLDKLQRDTTTLSDAVEIWKDMLESEELSMHKKTIEKRYKEIMEPEHFLANMMDPRFNGKRLSPEEETKAEEWIIEKHEDWLPGIMAFKIKDEKFFPKSLFLEVIVSQFSAAKWWNIAKEKSKKNKDESKLDDEFFTFFKSLHSVVCSSASIERFFSTFAFVWSKLRNRLGIEQCEKLVKIYKYYHSSNQMKHVCDDW